MSLGRLIQPWRGQAFRHLPSGPALDPLDFRLAGSGYTNRWNLHGQPTLYLAGDEGVMIAEWGRHFAVSRSPELERRAVERQVFRFDLVLDGALDLRDPRVIEALGLSGAPGCFAAVDVARATAGFIRQTTPAQAILVPPMAFPDDPARCVLVVFLEKLAGEPSRFITAVTACGVLRLGASSPEP